MSLNSRTRSTKFIFFREDGRTFGTADEPTPEDLAHARVGLHVIVRLADLHTFTRDGEWTLLAEGIVTEPTGVSPSYHVPEEFAD